MKRCIVILLVFLLLGAIVNIAVAWGALLPVPRPPNRSIPWNSRPGAPTSEEVALWNRHASAGWPPAPATTEQTSALMSIWHLRAGAFGTIVYTSDTPNAELREMMTGIGDFFALRISCGFPMRCCAWECWNGAPQYSGFAASSGDDGWHVLGLTLPRAVLGLGFAINTLFYAAILWLLFTSRLALPYARRRRRIKRGLCPACAYPVGTSDLCTECGKPLPGRDAGRSSRSS